MGSLQQLQFEFPIAFLEALVTAPYNTNIMLMDAQFENREKCNFLGWKSEDVVTLVLEGKDSGLSLQAIDQVICCRVRSGAAEEQEGAVEEFADEEPQYVNEEEAGDQPEFVEEQEEDAGDQETGAGEEFTDQELEGGQVLKVESMQANEVEEHEAQTYEVIMEQDLPTQEERYQAITEDAIITTAEMADTDLAFTKVLYMCPDDGCILEFADIGGLMKHINSDFHRTQSNYTFLTEIVKQMEKSVVHDSEILRITCPLCQAQVGPKTAFRHIGDEHSNHPQYEFAVSYCKDTIRQHRKKRDLERTPGGKSCPHCGKDYHGLKNWRRHVKHWCRKNPNRVQIFMCTKCSFQSLDKNKFEAHQQAHLEDADSHMCQICVKPFKSEYGLGTHMNLMHPDQVKVMPYKCRNCQHTSETEEEHKIHLRKHKAVRFKCELCSAEYRNLTTLRAHVKQYHDGEFPVTCEKCGSGIANHEAVPFHRCSTKFKKLGSDEPKHKCYHCNALFKNTKVLANHIRYIHKDNYPYRCNDCGHGIRTKTALARHKCASARHRQGIIVQVESRRRGRPSKVIKIEQAEKEEQMEKEGMRDEEEEVMEEVREQEEKLAVRRSGRPRKINKKFEDADEEEGEDEEEEDRVVPRKRGRPRKSFPEVVEQDPAEEAALDSSI